MNFSDQVLRGIFFILLCFFQYDVCVFIKSTACSPNGKHSNSGSVFTESPERTNCDISAAPLLLEAGFDCTCGQGFLLLKLAF